MTNTSYAHARLAAVPAFCNAWGLDFTVGCEHACVYCPFERHQAVTMRRAHGGGDRAMHGIVPG